MEMEKTIMKNNSQEDANSGDNKRINDMEILKKEIFLNQSKEHNKNNKFFEEIQNTQLENHETLEIIESLEPNLIINKKTDDFVDFVQTQSIYIDKSLLIKEIINGGHMFFTAPQRWGKSLNISMIKAFFQNELEIPKKSQQLFENLAISDEIDIAEITKRLLLLDGDILKANSDQVNKIAKDLDFEKKDDILQNFKNSPEKSNLKLIVKKYLFTSRIQRSQKDH